MNPQTVLSIIMAVIAAVGGLLATLLLATFIMAAWPNSKRRDASILKGTLITTLLTGGVCIVGSIVAIVLGKEWLAVLIGAAPVVTSVLLVVVLVWLLRPTPGNF